jgi:Tol biopolymer transport system component
MGRCYEKLGMTEARKAYERLVRDYADQSEQVKLAQTRLAALSATGPATMTARRLENAPADAAMSAAVSPDGRYMTHADGETADLVLRDLQSGQDRPLTNEGTSWKQDVAVRQSAWGSSWSADGKMIAYSWSVGESGRSRVELRMIGAEGGKPRVLARLEDEADIASISWSPDGKQIAAVGIRSNEPLRIVLVSTTDGAVRILAELKREIFPVTVRFSPDGRHVAYDRLADESSPERDIFLRSIDTGQEIPLVRHPADDYLLGWSRDGRWLIFASDRTGALGLWVVRVSGTNTDGEPQLVKAGIDRILPVGLTNRGALFYSLVKVTEDVFCADLDPKSGKVAGPHRKMIESFEGGNFSPSYSPDGKFLAYISRRGNSPYPTNVGNALCVRSLETGQEKVYYREIWRLGLQYIDGPEWSPDGRFIVFVGSTGIMAREFYRLDVAKGGISRVASYGNDERISGWVCGPDGKFYYGRHDVKKNISEIVVRDLESGAERIQFKFPSLERGVGLAFSPDRKWLSFANYGWGGVRSLRVMPAGGGDPREIWNFGEIKAGMPNIYHAWSPDGRSIVFGAPDPKDLPSWELWRVPVEGGQPEKIGMTRRWGLWNLTIRPDGRQLAFAGRNGASSLSELWILENFLPPGKSR